MTKFKHLKGGLINNLWITCTSFLELFFSPCEQARRHELFNYKTSSRKQTITLKLFQC